MTPASDSTPQGLRPIDHTTAADPVATFDPLVPRPLDRPRSVDIPAVLAGSPRALADLDAAKIIAAPDDPAMWPAWRAALRRWRDDARERSGHDGAGYERAELAWTRRCVVVTQVWLWDELLYDWQGHEFTPERFLEDAQRRLGGFDGVLLWHAYPVIGVDERNQWDYYRLVPGLRQLVDTLHAHGVRVFVDYNPWDTGTRRARDDADELADLVRELGVDGVFLDTLKEGDSRLLEGLTAAGPGVAVEGESTLPIARLVDHPMSWAQWFADSPVPGVVRSRWFEQRHQLHHVRRWHRDHAQELRSAWLNGIGVMAWEVVFGVWVGWTAADGESLRVLSRTFRALSDLLTCGDWEPLTDLGEHNAAAGVHAASRFVRDTEELVTVVAVPAATRPASTPTVTPIPVWVPVSLPGRCLDVVTGALLERRPAALGEDGAGSRDCVLVHVQPGRLAGVWVAPEGTERDWLPERTDDPQVGASTRFPHRVARRVVTPRAAVGSAAEPSESPIPHEAAVIVPAGTHELTVRYRCRETGMYEGAPFVDEWKPLPPRLHDLRTLQRTIVLRDEVAVAASEVTAREWLVFIEATGYRPAEPGLTTSALAGAGAVPWWATQGNATHHPEAPSYPALPQGNPDTPATFVTLEDARAYARWRGGRLPTEDEWQLAASLPGFGRSTPLVWNLTESEHSDGRSRFLMLKGGSELGAIGSAWYVEAGPQGPDYAVKYLMPGSGLGRSASIGFRLAWDLS